MHNKRLTIADQVCSGPGPHLGMTSEPRGFSRVAAAFSSYDGDLSLPLGLTLGSPIFPSGCGREPWVPSTCVGPSKFGKLSSGHRTGKGQFSFQSQRKAMPKNAQTTAQLHKTLGPSKKASAWSHLLTHQPLANIIHASALGKMAVVPNCQINNI